jgi:peptidoglycan/LPS O-acetylase OafA/YrhL
MTDELRPLTSLRFVAATMIVIFHAHEIFPRQITQAPAFFPTAVSFFFVLSGFILTHVYRAKQVTYSQFVWLRVARLWPTHIAMLLFVMLLLPGAEGAGWFDPRLTAIANVFMLQSYVPFPAYYFSWDSASWSISTELFFYLLFPLLLVRIDWTWPWKLGAALVLSLLIVLLTTLSDLPQTAGLSDPAALSFIIPFPPMRLAEFCLGMAAYVLWKRYVEPAKLTAAAWTVSEGAALLLVVGWLIYFISSELVWRIPNWPLALWGYVAGGAPVFAILIIVLASGRGLLGSLLSRREFVYLGAISFSLYLLHQPFLRLFAISWPDLSLGKALLGGAALIVGSAALHELVEKPFRSILTKGRWSVRLRDRLRTYSTAHSGVIQACDVDPSDAWPDGRI